MKPITIYLPPEYAPMLARAREELNGFNPTGRAISSGHIMRYSLRVSSGQPRSELTARAVFSEDQRGKVRHAIAPANPPPAT